MEVRYGRRRSDNLAPALAWLNVAVLAVLWGVVLHHLAILGAAVGSAETATAVMRREAAEVRKERRFFAEALQHFAQEQRKWLLEHGLAQPKQSEEM